MTDEGIKTCRFARFQWNVAPFLIERLSPQSQKISELNATQKSLGHFSCQTSSGHFGCYGWLQIIVMFHDGAKPVKPTRQLLEVSLSRFFLGVLSLNKHRERSTHPKNWGKFLSYPIIPITNIGKLHQKTHQTQVSHGEFLFQTIFTPQEMARKNMVFQSLMIRWVSHRNQTGTFRFLKKQTNRHSFFVSKIVWSYFKVVSWWHSRWFHVFSLMKLGFSVELGAKRWERGSSRPPDKPSFVFVFENIFYSWKIRESLIFIEVLGSMQVTFSIASPPKNLRFGDVLFSPKIYTISCHSEPQGTNMISIK